MPNSLVDQVTSKLLQKDREALKNTKIPIVTISATYRDALEDQYRFDDYVDQKEVVFSRAHYSMALAAAVVAWGGDTPKPQAAWVVDPTNYVQHSDWKSVALSETLGKLMARHTILEWVKKNIVDTLGRKKFPLASQITPPLLHLFEHVNKPILSFHIVTGNILAQAGKQIVQVVTDPHVREDYIQFAHLPNIRFCVFDENTKQEFLELSAINGKKVNENKIIVTGPPIDPRVLAAKKTKRTDSWRRRPLRILLTTGGLGTNKDELELLLRSLLPLTRRKHHGKIQILYYAGTNTDHVHMVENISRELGVKIEKNLREKGAALRVLSADNIVDANNLLLLYGFPWADLVYTKPSGDMAYDAVAAGCALLLLKPWGEWEVQIQGIMAQYGVSRIAELTDEKTIIRQIEHITDKTLMAPWIEKALEKTRTLPIEFERGSFNIVRAVSKK